MHYSMGNRVQSQPNQQASNAVRERLLRSNPIAAIWRIAHVANYYVFPMFAEFDRSLGLTRSQFVSLLCLCHGGATSAQEIVVGSGLPKNSISRAVRELEARQLLTRSKSRKDLRSIDLEPTASGAQLLDHCLEFAAERQARALAALSEEERAQLDILMSKLCDHVPEWAEMRPMADIAAE